MVKGKRRREQPIDNIPDRFGYRTNPFNVSKLLETSTFMCFEISNCRNSASKHVILSEFLSAQVLLALICIICPRKLKKQQDDNPSEILKTLKKSQNNKKKIRKAILMCSNLRICESAAVFNQMIQVLQPNDSNSSTKPGGPRKLRNEGFLSFGPLK